MSKQFIVILIAFFLKFNFGLYGQNKIDEDKVLLIKLTLLNETFLLDNARYTKELIDEFLSLNIQIDTLQYRSFEDFSFYRVSHASLKKAFSNFIIKTHFDLPITCNEYILAINRSSYDVYRLKGFRKNDFPSLIIYLNPGLGPFRNKKKFLKNYYVEGVDFKCLFKVFKNYNNNNTKYPCIDNCSDLKVVQ